VGVDMFALKGFVEQLDACKITRIDLAHDDLEGLTGVRDFKLMYETGAFFNQGPKSKARFIDDMGSCSGETLYIGSKKNGKEACIYEKGKQLGDEKSSWVRVEGRLTAVNRVVSFDAMINPAQYLAGLYPPFANLSAIHARLVIIKKHVKIALDRLLEYARIAYGPLINYLKIDGYSDSEIVALLIRDGVPKRLAIPVMAERNMIPF
jgi:phage replication initiation protein